jgi:hypothetical protein
MDRLIYYETEEDYKNNNFVAECSIVQYTYNKKKNELIFKKNVMGSPLHLEGMDRVIFPYDDKYGKFIIVVIGGKGYEW